MAKPHGSDGLDARARRPKRPLTAFPSDASTTAVPYSAPYGQDEPDPAPFDEPRFTVLIRRISCSFSSSNEVLFSFPLRYLFAIGYLLSYLALDGQHHLYSVNTFKLTYSRPSPLLAPPTRSRVTLCAPGSQPVCCGLPRGEPTLRLQVPKCL